MGTYACEGSVHETRHSLHPGFRLALARWVRQERQWAFRAARRRQAGDHDKAIADFSEAIRLDPKRADAYYGRGTAYGHKGEYDKAIADYSDAIRLAPPKADAYLDEVMPTGRNATSTAPSPTTRRPSGSKRNTPMPISVAATPTGTRAISTKPLPT